MRDGGVRAGVDPGPGERDGEKECGVRGGAQHPPFSLSEGDAAAVAMAMGARLSDPGPMPTAAGRTPKIIERAVMSTGRIRTGAAVLIAVSLSMPRCRN